MNLKAIKTLAHKAFRNSGGLKTEGTALTFIILLSFAIAYILVLVSYVFPWRLYSIWEDSPNTLLVINEPETFGNYLDIIGLPRTNSDHFQTDAYYDFSYFEELMRSRGGIVVLVFPKGFDETVSEGGEIPEILTYCRTDYLISNKTKDNVKDSILKGYLGYVQDLNGKTVALYPPVETATYGTPTAPQTDMATGLLRFAAQSLIPLILFVSILYAAMNSGTNIIAGEKERGTFAAILLSPVPRLQIILGDLIGVSMGSLLPALIMTILVFLIPSYSGIAGFLVALPLLISLVLLIASLTILISVLSDSVVSAQTAFLPLFFIMVTICVTCIQNAGEASDIYYLIPIYGHFYGLGGIICNNSPKAVLYSGICIIFTLLIVAASVYVCVKLLSSERYTVNLQSGDDRVKAPADGKIKAKSLPGFILNQAWYPLVILSIFQTLAMLPVLVKYTSTSAFAEIVNSMRGVTTFAGVLKFSFDLLGLFLSDPLFIVSMSVGYLLMILCYLVMVCIREKLEGKHKIRRHMASLGFELTKGTAGKYFGGVLLGISLMSLVYLILNVTGQVRYEGINKDTIGAILLSLLMWLPQGACEELMFRGYMLPRITKKTNKIFAFFLSSALFSLLHSMNAGYTPMASVNLFLIALLFALISYRSGSIWITSGAHTAWNFCQGNFYGLQVSGNELTTAFIKTTYTANHSDLITGGSFGPEGGLAVTLVTLPLIVLLLVLIKRDGQKADRLW